MQQDNQTHEISVSQHWGTTRLRLLFLVPMAIVIALVVFMLSMALYEYTNREVEDGVIRIRGSVQNFYEESIRYDAKALQAILHTLRQDEKLATALTQGNRDELLRLATPLFQDIRRDFDITHLYFTGTDRINLVRVHSPLRYGDVIERTTMQQAEKSGSIAYGVELGPLGTFTLRVVAPWYDEQTHDLIGYVELGMEIDQVLNKLQTFFDVQAFTLVNKEFLDRKEWEAGMRAMGRTPHWDCFPRQVTSEQSMQKIPPHLAQHLKTCSPITHKDVTSLFQDHLSYRVTALPLQDAAGHMVADLVLLTDMSDEEDLARNTVYIGIMTALIAGGILLIFFYWLVGRIGQRIENNEKKLRRMATHDGLTDLYNHKFFYTLLEDEITRAERYQHHVSLLLLDIDHFKNVNDTYGHRSGDIILREVSKRLVGRLRSTDWVCRYGGEELTVILPETDISVAQKIGEDLRLLIEQAPFEIEDGQHITITVSTGVATYPQHGKDASTLVSGADTALYEAKETGRNCVCTYNPQKEET